MIDLYRFYDKAGDLLYVGISLSAAHRASQHRNDKGWWLEVVRMDVEHLPVTRTKALRIELEAIATESPRYNVMGSIVSRRTASRLATIKRTGIANDKKRLYLLTAPICPECNTRPVDQYRKTCYCCLQRARRRKLRADVTVATVAPDLGDNACIPAQVMVLSPRSGSVPPVIG